MHTGHHITLGYMHLSNNIICYLILLFSNKTSGGAVLICIQSCRFIRMPERIKYFMLRIEHASCAHIHVFILKKKIWKSCPIILHTSSPLLQLSILFLSEERACEHHHDLFLCVSITERLYLSQSQESRDYTVIILSLNFLLPKSVPAASATNLSIFFYFPNSFSSGQHYYYESIHTYLQIIYQLCCE